MKNDVGHPGSFLLNEVDPDTGKISYVLYYNGTIGGTPVITDRRLYPGIEVPALVGLLHTMFWKSIDATDGTPSGALFSVAKPFPSSKSSEHIDVLPIIQVPVIVFILHMPIARMLFSLSHLRRSGFRKLMFRNGIERKSYALNFFLFGLLSSALFSSITYGFGLGLGLPVFVINSGAVIFVVFAAWSGMCILLSYIAHLACENVVSDQITLFFSLVPWIVSARYLNSGPLMDEEYLLNSIEIINLAVPSFTLYRMISHLSNASGSPEEGITVSNSFDPEARLDRLLLALAVQAAALLCGVVIYEGGFSELGVRRNTVFGIPVGFFSRVRQNKKNKVSKTSATDPENGEVIFPAEEDFRKGVSAEDTRSYQLGLEKNAEADIPFRIFRISKRRQVHGKDIASFANRVSICPQRDQITVILTKTQEERQELIGLFAGESLQEEGAVFFRSERLESKSRSFRTGVSFSVSDSCFPPTISAKTILHFFSSCRSTPSAYVLKDIKEVLYRFRLQFTANAPVSAFSPAMVQRLRLAVAFVGFPETVVLDEPFADLDNESRDICIESIRWFASCGRSVILVTSQMSLAACTLADKLVVLHRGTVRALGSWSELNDILKNQLWIFMTLEDPVYEDDVDGFMQTTVPNATSVWMNGNSKAYVVDARVIKQSFLFEEVGRNAVRLHIVDWIVTTRDIFAHLQCLFSDMLL
eukprot:ANDGO_02578.mRNA.1 ABC transporter A family member 5